MKAKILSYGVVSMIDYYIKEAKGTENDESKK